MAGGAGISAEITVEHGCGGNKTGDCVGLLPGARALIAAEEEQLVFANRSTDNPAVLVALERVLLGGEVVLRIHIAVAEELEQGSVERVAAGPGNNVHHRARVNPVLRRQTGSLHAELLNGVREGKGQIDVSERVVIVRGVHQVVDVGGLGARDRERHRAGIVLARSQVGRRSIGRSRRQQDQLRGLAAIQRQIDCALPVNDLRYRLIFGLHHGCRGLHLHRLRDAANL